MGTYFVKQLFLPEQCNAKCLYCICFDDKIIVNSYEVTTNGTYITPDC